MTASSNAAAEPAKTRPKVFAASQVNFSRRSARFRPIIDSLVLAVYQLARRNATKIVLTVCWLGVASVAQADIATGLVGWWQLDQTSGSSAPDGSGNGNNGTVSGTATWVAGQIANAFDFNQATVITCGTSNSLNVTTAGTIAAWIDPDDLGANSLGRIVDRRDGSSNGYLFYVASDSGNKIAFFSNSQHTSTTEISFGTWQHVAVTWSGTSLAFYINGSPAGTATMGAGISSAGGQTFRIGDNQNGNRDFDGRMDDVRVYSRQLSADDIAELAANRGLLKHASQAGGLVGKGGGKVP